MAKLIKLTCTKGKSKYAIVDDEDYEKVIGYKSTWMYRKDEKKELEYAISNIGNGKMIRMHRFILGLKRGDAMVDHINHNGLDNRKKNLRLCDVTHNNGNARKLNQSFSSKYKGVSWDKKRKKWAAYIQKHGVKIDIGKYDTEQEAALAYNNMKIELYGEFACLNIIE